MNDFAVLLNTIKKVMPDSVIRIDINHYGISVLVDNYKNLPKGYTFRPYKSDIGNYPWRAEVVFNGIRFSSLLDIDESYELYV